MKCKCVTIYIVDCMQHLLQKRRGGMKITSGKGIQRFSQHYQTHRYSGKGCFSDALTCYSLHLAHPGHQFQRFNTDFGEYYAKKEEIPHETLNMGTFCPLRTLGPLSSLGLLRTFGQMRTFRTRNSFCPVCTL